MTSNQIAYQSYLENARSNRAREAETNRSNLANERETNRSNVARETETNRHNVATEGNDFMKLVESNRHNVATEQESHRANSLNYDLGIRNVNEAIRSHKASENITREGNYIKEFGALGPLMLGSYSAEDYKKAAQSLAGVGTSIFSDAFGPVKDIVGGKSISEVVSSLTPEPIKKAQTLAVANTRLLKASIRDPLGVYARAASVVFAPADRKEGQREQFVNYVRVMSK